MTTHSKVEIQTKAKNMREKTFPMESARSFAEDWLHIFSHVKIYPRPFHTTCKPRDVTSTLWRYDYTCSASLCDVWLLLTKDFFVLWRLPQVRNL